MLLLIKKIVICFVLITSFFFLPAYTKQAHALVPPYVAFGGRVEYEFPCTCSENLLVIVAPFFYNSPTPIIGDLVYEQGTISYLNYLPVIGGPILGSFLPGVQACYMYAVYGCFPLPNYGIIGSITGTGK